VLEKIKKSRLGQGFKNSGCYKIWVRSCGDWRYPFISFGWFLSGLLVPRRKVSVDGVEFSLSCVNWITHFRWYLFESKEREVRNYINNNVKEGDVFFDIGANVCVFSVYCAKRFNNVSVHSFEPEYSNLSLLKENVVFNRLTEKIKIYSVAMSDFVGMSLLNIQDTTPGAAVHTESKTCIQTTTFAPIQTSSSTLITPVRCP